MGRRRSATKVNFAGLDEENKIDPKEKLKQEIDNGLSKLSSTMKKKPKEETKKPHPPYLKSAMKKSSLKIPSLDEEEEREDGPKGPKPFDEPTNNTGEDFNVEATDEEFNLIFTHDDPRRDETKKLLLFQYKIKFMRGAKTFTEEMITFALLI